MSRATSIKDACANFEKKTGKKADEEEHVSLICQIPSIDKMDASLSTLKNCTKLSLSSNQIEKIANLNALRNLKILSLGRNNIKSLTGLDAVGDSLTELWISYNQIEKLKGISLLKKLTDAVGDSLTELWISYNQIEKLKGISLLKKLTDAVGDSLTELWISYNQIEKLKGISLLKKLTTLYMVHNKVSDADELKKIDELPCLEKLTFQGNPLAVEWDSQGVYRQNMQNKVKRLKQLDGQPIIREEVDDDGQQQQA